MKWSPNSLIRNSVAVNIDTFQGLFGFHSFKSDKQLCVLFLLFGMSNSLSIIAFQIDWKEVHLPSCLSILKYFQGGLIYKLFLYVIFVSFKGYFKKYLERPIGFESFSEKI